MSDLLKVSGLCVGLRDAKQPIVADVGFTLREGAALALVGESGSGKTLTCKAILQLLGTRTFHISGSVFYREAELLSMKEQDIRALCGCRISMIVQNPMSAFDPAVKIGAQIVETIRAHKNMTKKDAYAVGRAALEKMNLPRCSQLMNSYPHTLSGGMLQRIVIALALILEPEIIIADEATTALDVKNQKDVLDEIEKMKKSGIGVLLVTHDFGVAAKLADDVIVMKDGKIVERGTVREIFASPKESYTKALLKASLLTKEDHHD